MDQETQEDLWHPEAQGIPSDLEHPVHLDAQVVLEILPHLHSLLDQSLWWWGSLLPGQALLPEASGSTARSRQPR